MRPVQLTRETLAVLAGRKRIFRGWWILTVAVISLGLMNGVAFWSMGLFIEPLEEDFGWSRAQVSLGFSLSLGLSGLAAPLAGRWVDSRGPRSAIIIGGIATALTYVLLATTQELWQWYLYFSLNGLLRHFVFIIPFMALVARWFDRKRSTAASILAAGLMMGGIVVVPIMRILIDTIQWQGAFLVSGLTSATVIVSLALFVIRDDPAQVGEVPDGLAHSRSGSGGSDDDNAGVGGLTLREALHTRLFWVLALGMTFFPFGMVTWIAHAVPFYESTGLSPNTAAALVSLSAALAIPPRLIAGHFADRLPKLEYGAAGVGGLLAISMAILVVDTSPAAIFIFFPLFVLGFATGGALFEALLIPRAFGLQHYATILGIVMIIQTLGFIAGPTIAGGIFDATGSYDWVIVMLLGVFVATSLSFIVAAKLPHPLDEARSEDG